VNIYNRQFDVFNLVFLFNIGVTCVEHFHLSLGCCFLALIWVVFFEFFHRDRGDVDRRVSELYLRRSLLELLPVSTVMLFYPFIDEPFDLD
jgi:hypothetical protein